MLSLTSKMSFSKKSWTFIADLNSSQTTGHKELLVLFSAVISHSPFTDRPRILYIGALSFIGITSKLMILAWLSQLEFVQCIISASLAKISVCNWLCHLPRNLILLKNLPSIFSSIFPAFYVRFGHFELQTYPIFHVKIQ